MFGAETDVLNFPSVQIVRLKPEATRPSRRRRILRVAVRRDVSPVAAPRRSTHHGSVESTQPRWWQTLPGILTAVAAVISAIAGLVIALNGRSAGEEGLQQAAAHVNTPAAPAAATPATVAARTLGAPAFPEGKTLRLSGGNLILDIISARLEPFNADARLLRFRIRFTNNAKTFERSYYLTLRVVANGVPLAPRDPPLEQIEAQSALEIEYVFEIPATTGAASLRVSKDPQVMELPIFLQ